MKEDKNFLSNIETEDNETETTLQKESIKIVEKEELSEKIKNTNYFFYRVFQFKKNNKDFSNNANNNMRILLMDDVIIAKNKEEAKKIIINKHGNHPFKINKRNMKDDDIYFYISESSEYWYNRRYKEYTYTCTNCNKKVTIIGEQNLSSLKNHYGMFCSNKCIEKFEDKYALNCWINQTDNLNLPEYNKDSDLAGYIYRITNKIENKSYIGKTKYPPVFRWWQHLKKDDGKFKNVSIDQLVFEVLEVVYYNNKLEIDKKYIDKEEKLSFREMFYITHFETYKEEIGYNKMIETTKVSITTDTPDYEQLELFLEEQ